LLNKLLSNVLDKMKKKNCKQIVFYV